MYSDEPSWQPVHWAEVDFLRSCTSYPAAAAAAAAGGGDGTKVHEVGPSSC